MIKISMPGLCRASTLFCAKKDVDGREKAGHDGKSRDYLTRTCKHPVSTGRRPFFRRRCRLRIMSGVGGGRILGGGDATRSARQTRRKKHDAPVRSRSHLATHAVRVGGFRDSG